MWIAPVEGRRYRIFELEWLEVILLWFGREEIPAENKEAFIKALLNFDDNCVDFYRYQATLLASRYVAEYQECEQSNSITEHIKNYFCRQTYFQAPISDLKTPAAITALLTALDHEDSEVSWSAARALMRAIDPKAIARINAPLKEENSLVRLLAKAWKGTSDPKASATSFAAFNHQLSELRSRNIETWEKMLMFPTVAISALNLGSFTDRLLAAKALKGTSDPKVITALIAALKEENSWVRSMVVEALKGTSDKAAMLLIIHQLRHSESTDDKAVLLHCAQHLPYPDFYTAWHSSSTPLHPKIADLTPIGLTPSTQHLEAQFAAWPTQLQPTTQVHPIVISTHTLTAETDIAAIAQELCTQIYLTAFPDAEIPEGIHSAAQLRAKLVNLKRQLQKPQLALILHHCTPHTELVAFLEKLTDLVAVGWVSDQPVPSEQIYTFSPHNSVEAIQSWLSEL